METHFTKNGFVHQQLKREGRICIFRRSKNGADHYEVVRIRHHAAYEIAGVKFAAGEHYPGSSSWGADGFTYTDHAAAGTKFAELVAKEAIAEPAGGRAV